MENKGIYKCSVCGNIVSAVEAHDPNVMCCGVEMVKLEEKSGEEGSEKHRPVVEKIEGGVRVSVGSVLHPMESEHFIELIELDCDGEIFCKRLNVGDEPVVDFVCEGSVLKARALCNVHGLWSS